PRHLLRMKIGLGLGAPGIFSKKLGQRLGFLVFFGLALCIFRSFFLGGFCSSFLLGCLGGLFLFSLGGGFFLRLFGSFLLGLILGLFHGNFSCTLLFSRFGLGRLARCGLLGLICLSSIFSAFLFRLLGGGHTLLFGLALRQLLHFKLPGRGLLRFPSCLLWGLGFGLALGFQLIQGGLHDRP